MIRYEITGREAFLSLTFAFALSWLVSVADAAAFNPQPEPPGKQATEQQTLEKSGLINPGETKGAFEGYKPVGMAETMRLIGQQQAAAAANQAALAMQRAMQASRAQ